MTSHTKITHTGERERERLRERDKWIRIYEREKEKEKERERKRDRERKKHIILRSKQNIILNLNYFENNSIRNIVKVLSKEYNYKNNSIDIEYIDVYGNKNNYNINETNIDKIEFIDDENWYGRDFLFSDFMTSLEKVSDNQKNENKHPYVCCDSNEHDVKLITAHGCIFDPFVLPKGVKLITLGYLGCSIYDTHNLLKTRKISELYQRGHTIFENNDNNPDIMTKEAQLLLKDLKIFELHKYYAPIGFKLNLEGEEVNNYKLFFGDSCKTESYPDDPSMFCNIICINKSDGIYRNKCVDYVRFLKNNEKEISLSDLIKINGKGTYIVSACRNFCQGYTKQELSKTISAEQKRHTQFVDWNIETRFLTNDLKYFLDTASENDKQLYFKLVQVPKDNLQYYHNIKDINNYIKSGSNEELKLIFKKLLHKILTDEEYKNQLNINNININHVLFYAIWNNNIEIVKLLLKNGAKFNSINFLVFLKYFVNLTPSTSFL